jgi:hypothetical protein
MVVSDIVRIEGIVQAYCEWFESKISQRALYPIALLELASVFANSSSVKLKKAS